MPVYVLHMGQIIEKSARPAKRNAVSDLPAPAVQSFDAYASPIDNASVSSHRQRDRDLHNSGSYDPRDTPAAFRKAQNGRRKFTERAAAEPARHS